MIDPARMASDIHLGTVRPWVRGARSLWSNETAIAEADVDRQKLSVALVSAVKWVSTRHRRSHRKTTDKGGFYPDAFGKVFGRKIVVPSQREVSCLGLDAPCSSARGDKASS